MTDEKPQRCTHVDGVRRRALQSESEQGLDPGSHGFDFLFGQWSVAHSKLRQRLAGNRDWLEFDGTLEVTPILEGIGNVDKNVLQDPKGAYEATSLRLYNPRSRRWSIWWIDARDPGIGQPVVGGFIGTEGTFQSRETFEGKPIRVRTTYAPTSGSTARWTQAFSPDAGASWEINWVMEFSRA